MTTPDITDLLTKAERQLADVIAKREATIAKQQELEAAIVAFEDWRQAPNSAARDREYERQRDARLALTRLREGRLLRVAAEVYERVEDLDERRAHLSRKVAMLRIRQAANVTLP